MQTSQERFNKLYENLHNLKFQTLKPEKKIKAIHETIQKQCFIKYELNTTFDQVFETGQFNCVTGTALNGMILKKLNIPFEIKETENHVFVLSYPNQGNIRLEATDPMQRTFKFNDKFKEGWVEYLLNSKLISLTERSSNSVDELFNKYYFNNTHLSLKELIGLQYYNNAIALTEEKKNSEALTQIEKAYIFYPSERIEYTMQNILAMVLTQTRYDNIEDAKLFIKVARYLKRNLTVDVLKSEFARITQLQLVENSRLDHYKQLCSSIFPNIQNKELSNEILALYNYELGRFYYNKGERAESRDYFFNALKCKPSNSDMRMAFISAISEYISEQDLLNAIDKLEVYIKEFPFIKEHAQISNLLKNSYLYRAYLSFQDQKIEEGNKNLVKFETLHNESHNNHVESELVANAYSSASAYFYKRNNVKKAKEYINRGLKTDPNNYMLKNLLRSM
ncbi:MAG TPA: hypothetical protein VHO72_12765 [Bacteroidales bacterium]|nr:hypothetical protein [Bacteroidales bacterium]